MARSWAKWAAAGLTDVGRRRLANEDAWHIDERIGLFVVCDGIGGQPSGEAASQIVSRAMGHMVRRSLRQLQAVDGTAIQRLLADAAGRISEELHTHAQQIPALRGMGATLAAMLVERQQAHLVHVGDSRIYRYRGTADPPLDALTRDQVKHFRRFASVAAAAAGGASDERRLLSQYIGSRRPVEPVTRTIVLEPGDRLLLCSDGVTDPVPEPMIGKLLGKGGGAEATCRRLIDAANVHGGPDNITAIVIDFAGLEPMDPPRPASRSAPGGRRGLARPLHEALSLLERDLAWLRAGADELEGRAMLSAFAAVKRRLGPDVYHNFLQLHPSKNPTHVFHRACTLPESRWRQTYEQHLGELNPLMDAIADGSPRMSPILTGDETGLILQTLWHDWRKVESRYFEATQRDAISASDQTLSQLIKHMHQSVQTMLGLLVFFPRFMRPSD